VGQEPQQREVMECLVLACMHDVQKGGEQSWHWFVVQCNQEEKIMFFISAIVGRIPWYIVARSSHICPSLWGKQGRK